jgi:hypothetical protein
LTLTASSSAASGTASVTITAVAGGLMSTTTVALTVTVAPAPLPSVWLDEDIGAVGVAGSASYANGTFNVAGAGQGTFLSTADGFHFVYQPLSGDGSIVAPGGKSPG